MIVISKPCIEHNINSSRLKCKISGDYLGSEKVIWFSVEKEYAQYLVDEVADSFVLACMLPAVVHGEDITVNCHVSERLLFHLQHAVTFILEKSYNGTHITIHADQIWTIDFGGKAVGCGCSLGIDSLSAIFTHMDTPETPDYEISHLTYFNVGSHGYKNAEANRKSWLHDMVKVKQFAETIHLPLVLVESNVYELFDGFNFDQSGNFINMATVLSLQKLFRKYLYGSNYPITATHLTNVCSGYFESLMIPIVSTESTELIVANADMARSDKTEIVAKHPLSKNNLYVCWKELIVNNNPNHPIAKIKDRFLNCTRCDKCLRTCTQLDILGVLEDFRNIFDINYYRLRQKEYIGKCIATAGSNEFSRDIVAMADKYKYRIPFASKLYALAYKTHLMGIYFRLKSFFQHK